MKIASLLQKLPFIGEAEGDRLTYYVFEGNRAYLVVSPNSRRGLNLNMVDQEARDLPTVQRTARNQPYVDSERT